MLVWEVEKYMRVGVYWWPHGQRNWIGWFHILCIYMYTYACTCICALHMYAVPCVEVTINNESMSIQ